MDIRIHGVGFDAPVPIQLKIANNNWSGAKLRERLENQLVGQYLRDQRSRLGIFLLVNTGQKRWEHPETGNKMSFHELLDWLQVEGTIIVERNQQVDCVEIIGIDLTRRCLSSVERLEANHND
ncbi:MAG: hypothetical protein V3V05_00850 [Pontiella sp.]